MLRDMFQNHLLQLLCMTAMEPPVGLDAEAVRDEKGKLLKSVRPVAAEEVAAAAVRGQYGAGRMDGQEVAGYRAGARGCEEFAERHLCGDPVFYRQLALGRRAVLSPLG